MARLPRIVVPGQPLHIIQRGNNRQSCFFADDDHCFYLASLKDAIKGSELLKSLPAIRNLALHVIHANGVVPWLDCQGSSFPASRCISSNAATIGSRASSPMTTTASISPVSRTPPTGTGAGSTLTC